MTNYLLSAQRVVLALQTNGLVDGLIKLIAGILIGILAGAAVWVAFKGGAEYYKGNGSVSIIGIVAKVLCILLIMGLVIALASNYQAIAQKFGLVADKAVDVVGSEAEKIATISDGGGSIPEPKAST